MSALKPGRPIRYRPSTIGGIKPPECAGIYYICDAEGNNVYTGQAVNLRRRVYQHKRNGKIPEGGYVDCFQAKDGVTYDELDETERAKINKNAPPLNRRKGGGGRKSSKLNRNISTYNAYGDSSLDQTYTHKHHFLYRLLRYEKIDKSGEIHYIKEPKSVVFMLFELILKLVFITTILIILLGLYLKFTKGIIFDRYLLNLLCVIPIICYIVFHYIRRSRVFIFLTIFSLISVIVLYYSSYPELVESIYILLKVLV